jgi:prophage regulatory protein
MPIRNDAPRARALVAIARAAKTQPLPPVAETNHRGKRLLLKPAVLERVGLSYPTLWKMMREGTFPRARSVGTNVAWVEDEIDSFITNLPKRRLKGDAPTAR